MDWAKLIAELGAEIGLFRALVFIGLAYWGWSRDRRVTELTDKLIEQNGENISAMHKLTSAIRERRTPDV